MRTMFKVFSVVALTAAGLSAAALTVGRNSNDPPISIEVDRAGRKLIVYQNGAESMSFDIAVGRESHPTPAGQFYIEKVIWNPGWVPPEAGWSADEEPKDPGDPENPMQGVKIYFNPPDYFIHGTNSPQSIGEAASHGCIRMEVDDALMLGRALQDLSGSQQDDEWYADVTGDPTETKEVMLGSPVPIVIR